MNLSPFLVKIESGESVFLGIGLFNHNLACNLNPLPKEIKITSRIKNRNPSLENQPSFGYHAP
jgi:hypothetical protein